VENNKSILVTGATGYIGGRLVPKLLGEGYHVKVLSRDPTRLRGRKWDEQVEIYQGDAQKPDTLAAAMKNVSAAYYLIHNMSHSTDFLERDLTMARNFGHAAKEAGVDRIIYLGGLGDSSAELSEYLKSSQETGRTLAEAGVPVTEFRAAVVIGSGSILCEMIRFLTERIPVMICPRWVFTQVQPISIQDVLSYLASALKKPESIGRIIEIGGSDVLTYAEMMKGYAKKRGLKRIIIPVPISAPRLSSYWVHWMTPVPASITRPLIGGLQSDVIVHDGTAAELFPEIQPIDFDSAVDSALSGLNQGKIETRWSDSMTSSMGDLIPTQLDTDAGMLFDKRHVVVKAPANIVYETFSQLGGERGWLFFNWAWEIRGQIDRLFGGVGLRRGRRDPVEVRFGDAIDFWRVEAVRTNKLLRLRAEMKVPGKAWLQFDAIPIPETGETKLVQTAYFDPKGLFGILYWYSLLPIHRVIFAGMIRKIRDLAEKIQKSENQT
jgi:uncharacterized protein YbjT (DUF2867 family)